MAVQALSIQTLLNIPVTALLLTDSISTRFLHHNMDPEAGCKYIAEELEYSVILVLEMRHRSHCDRIIDEIRMHYIRGCQNVVSGLQNFTFHR